jgi:hypothetical protein
MSQIVLRTAGQSARHLSVLQLFIDDLPAFGAVEPDMGKRMKRTRPLLERLVKDDGLKGHSAIWPSTEGGKNVLSSVDQEFNFVINGVLDGTESLERFSRSDDGSKPGYAGVKLSSATTGSLGEVDLVPPYDIHAKRGGSTRPVDVILRSQPLGEGTVLQKGFDLKANRVVERFGTNKFPYELNA